MKIKEPKETDQIFSSEKMVSLGTKNENNQKSLLRKS